MTDRPNRRARLRKALTFTAATLLAGTALSSVATQYVAGRLNHDPALGQPIVGGLYAPWDWITWQQKPWAKSVERVFAPVQAGTLGLVGLGLAGALIADNRRRRRPKKYDTLHGTAKFATDEDIQESVFADAEGGAYVGAWTDKHGRVRYLRHNGPEHIAAIAPTRSGKGVGLVIPTLLSWPGSTIVFDEKGELWELSAGWRKQFANNVVLRYQPGSPTDSCGFNFLEEVRLGTPYEVADAQNISVMICDPEGKGFTDHWGRTSFALITGVILHELYKARTHGRTASLPDVALAISDPSRPADKLYEEMAKNKHLPGGKRHDAVAAAGREQLNREERERSAVHSSCTTYMQIFVDPIVAKNSRHSDFRIRDLMNHDTPTSLYLMVPGSDKVRLKPLIRLMLTMIIRGLTSVPIEFDAERQPVMPHKHRLLFMLDEFPSLGKLAVFEDALAKIAGFGMKAYLVMQDREQLLAAYHSHETIMSNCHVTVAYAPNKLETAKWISELLGSETINVEEFSESGKRAGFLSQVSHSIRQVSRPLMTAEEVMTLAGPKKVGAQIISAGELLLWSAGMKGRIRGRQILYFQDPIFAQRAAVLPPDKSDSLTAGSTFQLARIA